MLTKWDESFFICHSNIWPLLIYIWLNNWYHLSGCELTDGICLMYLAKHVYNLKLHCLVCVNSTCVKGPPALKHFSFLPWDVVSFKTGLINYTYQRWWFTKKKTNPNLLKMTIITVAVGFIFLLLGQLVIWELWERSLFVWFHLSVNKGFYWKLKKTTEVRCVWAAVESV